MKYKICRSFGVILVGCLLSIATLAQQGPQQDSVLREKAVRLFIDCYFCDDEYIRQEIPYVNYVRDVKEAQVYLRVSSQQTGSGGREYTLTFIGQDLFDGMNDTLHFATRPDDTRDHRRIARTQMMKMGLMRYVARTPLYNEVDIYPDRGMTSQEVVDRWNNWVFEIESRPSLEGEESYKELSFRNSANIGKISNEWKLQFELDHRYTMTRYTFDDTVYTRSRSYQGMENLIVKSLGEHWSAGLRMDLLSSTFNNTKFGIDVFPSIEYNLFPYSESTHRQLRFLYGIGNSFNMYNDSTIYNRIRENRIQQKLQVGYQVQEKWGSINVSLEGSNYFYQLSKNRIELNGYVQIRIIKGLSFMIYGGVARVNDQLSLLKGELSEADILLRLQELSTAYEFDASFGITYTFGSIYNNIVNPRFGSGRRYYR